MYHSATEKTFQRDQIIFKEGSYGDSVYIIKAGSVEISKMIKGQKFVLEVLRSGDIFGSIGYKGMTERASTARAIGKTVLSHIDQDFINREMKKLSPDFKSILTALSERNKKLIDTTFELSSRTDPRTQKRLAVTYKDNGSMVTAYTINISPGGLLIQTEKPLDQGKKFYIELRLPGLLEPMNIRSEVAWVECGARGSYLMGAKFLKMNEKDNEILKQYANAIWLLSK